MAKQQNYKIKNLINDTGAWIQRQPGREQPFYGYEQGREEFGQGFFPQFKNYIENPLADPAYKTYLNEGINAIRGQGSLTGSPSSGRTQIAEGRFTEGLTAQQLSDRDKMLLAATQFRGSMPQSQMPQFLGASAGAFQAKAALMQAQAAQSASGGSGGFGGFSNLLGAGLGMLGGPSGISGMAGNMFAGASGLEGPLMANGNFFSSPLWFAAGL